jgi:mono/diheme cytochrome c family protein
VTAGVDRRTALRYRPPMHRAFKFILGGVGAVFGVVAIAIGAVYGVTSMRLSATYVVPKSHVPTPGPESAARGKHLAETMLLCVDCHGADLGGRNYQDVPGLLSIIGPNITPGKGSVLTYDDASLATLLRHGVRPNGTAVFIMPADNFVHLSEDDLGAVIAYVRGAAPIERTMGKSEVRFMGRLVWFAGLLELQPARALNHDLVPVAHTPTEPTALGEYIVDVAGCHACHGPTLSGGHIPGTPPDFPIPSDITFDPTGLGTWTRDDFNHAVRQGKAKDGHTLAAFMPWAFFNGMTDDELDAVWTYLQTVPKVPFGER